MTPNPDVGCNRFVKFGAFRRHALEELGADCVATGHYARLGQSPVSLHRAVDLAKDQSYFLSRVRLEDFDRVWFPLGDMLKQDVRLLAQQAGLPSASRKDSYGLCFVGKRKLKGGVGDVVVCLLGI